MEELEFSSTNQLLECIGDINLMCENANIVKMQVITDILQNRVVYK
jgi:hypothetical protein